MATAGEVLRDARLSARLSLGALAAKTNYSKGHLANVESGRRQATADVVLAYERVLGDGLKRRGALIVGVAGLVAPAAAAELLAHGFAAALTEDSATVDWDETVWRYGRDYMTAGAGDVQTRLTADLVVIQQQFERPRVWAAAARLLAVYGKTTTDAQQAIGWYQNAAIAADRSDHTETRVWVRGRAAIALAYEAAELPIAKEFAEQAIAIANDRPSLGLLNAMMARAHVYGARGQLTEAMRADDEARRIFDVVASDPSEASDFAVPEWRMATFRSMLYSRLGHPRAVEAGKDADRTRPDTLPRFATHIELHRGLMLAREGDHRSGVIYARKALAALPPERHSLSLRLMLAEVERVGRSRPALWDEEHPQS